MQSLEPFECGKTKRFFGKTKANSVDRRIFQETVCSKNKIKMFQIRLRALRQARIPKEFPVLKYRVQYSTTAKRL